MLIKTGIAVSDMSGSSGGVTAARNRWGLYLRSRVTPVNPNTDRQAAAKNIMSYLAEQWREAPMTDAKRIAWATYAASFNWSNKLGESSNLTGFNAFVQCNAARLALGGTLITAGPATLGLPATDPAFAVTGPSEANQAADIAFDDTFDWAAEDDGFMSLFMGQPQSPSVNFFGGPWRRWRSLDGNTAVPLVSPQLTKSGPPFTVVEGQKIWYEARIIRADGRISNRFRCPPVIAVA